MTNNQMPEIPKISIKNVFFKLKYRKPVTASLRACDKFLGRIGKRRVRLTWLSDKLSVSTVFLCIDHNFFSLDGGGTPLLFETAVNRNGEFEVIERCATWRQALKMHWAAVNELRGK